MPATTILRSRRLSPADGNPPSEDRARMEAAAIEAGRWLRRTGRVSLPVRTPRR